MRTTNNPNIKIVADLRNPYEMEYYSRHGVFPFRYV